MTAYLDNSYIKFPSADIDDLLTIAPGENFAVYLVFKFPSISSSDAILVGRIGSSPADDWGLKCITVASVGYIFCFIGGVGWFQLSGAITADTPHAVLLGVRRSMFARLAIDSPDWISEYETNVGAGEDKTLGAGRDLTIGGNHDGGQRFKGSIAEVAIWKGVAFKKIVKRQALMTGGYPHRGQPLTVNRDNLVFCADLRQPDSAGKAIGLITGKSGDLVGSVSLLEDAGEMFSTKQELYVQPADEALDETRPTLIIGAGTSVNIPVSLESGQRYNVAHIGETQYGRRSDAVQTPTLLIGDGNGDPQMLPRRPQNVRAELGAGGNVTLKWSDGLAVKGSDPTDFAIYGNGGNGPVDLASPIVTEAWAGQKEYSKDLGQLAADQRWAFIVRARAGGGVDDGNRDIVLCTPRADAPAPLSDPIWVQVTDGSPVLTDLDST